MAATLSIQDRHPELFAPPTDIDRRSRERTVPMEVMNLAFLRCGTMSMQRALDILGYHCYHSILFFPNTRDCEMWNAAQDAKFFGRGPVFTRREWDQLLGDYSAISADAPAIAFAEELIATYPEAKVILVKCEIEQWYTSFDAAIVQHTWSPWLNFMRIGTPFSLVRFVTATFDG